MIRLSRLRFRRPNVRSNPREVALDKARGSRRWLRPIVYALIWVVDRVVPKREQAAVHVWPDFDDQGVAIAEALYSKNVPVYWLLSDRRLDLPPAARARGDKARSRYSIRGHWVYFRSRYVFFTHGIYGFAVPPSTKVVVNLWHGMPVKKIGRHAAEKPMRAHFTLATSPLFAKRIADSWNMNQRQVLISGLPRNDIMLRTAASGTEHVKSRLGLPPCRRLILWLPTFRRSVHGSIRKEGVSCRSAPGGVNGFDRVVFESMLEESNSTCILKKHPMAAAGDFPSSSDRFQILGDADLLSHGVSLYEVLGATDVLISDASSAWVDFLLLDRPIVLAFGDMTEYRADRGFALEPIADWLPGPHVNDFQAMLESLKRILSGEDLACSTRHSIRHAMHTHLDTGAASRILEFALGSAPADRRRV